MKTISISYILINSNGIEYETFNWAKYQQHFIPNEHNSDRNLYRKRRVGERKKTKIKQWEIDLIIYFNYELLGGLLFKWVSQFHYYATDFSCEINWRLIYILQVL